MISCEIKVINAVGLHARPASSFALLASRFSSNILISKKGTEVKKNGKSIVGIMSLCIKQNDDVLIEAVGADENEAIQNLQRLLESGCGE